MTSPADAGALPPELRRQFIVLVAVVNLAMLATALGVLVLLFWSRSALGGALVAAGVAAAAFAWRRYRGVRDGTARAR